MKLLETSLTTEIEKSLSGLFYYNPDTGRISLSASRRGPIEVIRGSRNGKTYYRVKIGKTHVAAHRLAWRLLHGNWPVGEIDHIDGNTMNNCADNLRDVSKAINQRNQRLSRKNTTGVCGVIRAGKKYRAAFKLNDKKTHVGTFNTIEEATAALCDARAKHGFSPSHGMPR